MTSVYVQVPAFEEPTVEDTLRQIREQAESVPEDVTLEAWVTRSEDESGWCSTWASATSVDGVDTYEAPEGKLSARNAAHNHAADNGADAIASWDADAPPLTDTVLQSMIDAVGRSGVSLVNSTPRARDGTLLGVVIDAGSRAEDSIRPHAHGQLHAFPIETWEKVGPFDESIDQTNVQVVRREEEFRFYNEAAQIGEVAEPRGAQVFNDPRRHYCYFPGMDDKDFCTRIGGETF